MHDDSEQQNPATDPGGLTVDLAHYPELARDAADPAAALRRLGRESGVDLTALKSVEWGTASPGPVLLELETSRGWAQITIQREHREIELELSAPGLRVAWGGMADLQTVAEIVAAWREGTPAAEMQGRWASLEANPLAVAYEEGRAAEYQWQTLLDLPAGSHGNMLARAAYAVPQLRSLFPVLSHGKLEFSHCTLPFSFHDLPSVHPASTSTWRVYYPSDSGKPPIEAASIEEAVTLVAEGIQAG